MIETDLTVDVAAYAPAAVTQYTPPMLTRLNCRVASASAVCTEFATTTTADGCVHNADTTQLDFAVGECVQTRRDCRQLVADSVHTADATQLDG